ncbi:MAG: serine protease [Elusimicrobiota bacterium]
MKRLAPAALSALVLVVCVVGSFASSFAPKVVYGEDSRQDLWQVKNARMLQLADSTMALFKAWNVEIKDERAVLSVQNYGESHNLCAGEPFREQIEGAFCSGFVAGPDIAVTAGHCIASEAACKNTRFVFGFSIRAPGENPTSVPAREVYGCEKILERHQQYDGTDYAVVRLDREVKGHRPLEFEPYEMLQEGDSLFVIGHPSGLPTKVAQGARVRDVSHPGFFVANLDTYGGNSGSAVFNARTGYVEGILVRGEADFIKKDTCYVSNQCPDDSCRGEDVTRISSIQAWLPRPPHGPIFSEANPAFNALLREARAEDTAVKMP